ncbi:hypothetical protein Pr1d_44410 [Bythopirellula goksoeyrii]|uniref:Uncharacterized protein n=1 Tax=Bythopirellula goksoeyrii TaxID=1400387 RepID=A0A5B9QSH9_9BACT|nr:hypothetical protein Pr1d_44410 [Bythopirellula goksoeyrii]
MDKHRLDKTAIRLVPLEEEGDDRAFWATKTPTERLAALECLRRAVYGNELCEAKMLRVIRVIDCPWSTSTS